MLKVVAIGATLAVIALAAACQDQGSSTSTASVTAPKPSAGTVSSNDKVSDAGADH